MPGQGWNSSPVWAAALRTLGRHEHTLGLAMLGAVGVGTGTELTLRVTSRNQADFSVSEPWRLRLEGAAGSQPRLPEGLSKLVGGTCCPTYPSVCQGSKFAPYPQPVLKKEGPDVGTPPHCHSLLTCGTRFPKISGGFPLNPVERLLPSRCFFKH